MSYHSTNEAQDEMEKTPPALIRNPTLKTTYDRALINEKLESMKEHIHHMYMIEDRSLKEVMDAIVQSHNFKARWLKMQLPVYCMVSKVREQCAAVWEKDQELGVR